MDKIHIVSWILTRRCDLKCNYCRISRDYKKRPLSYPDLKYYEQHEISTESIIKTLKKFKLHNRRTFNIFYGGEPTFRIDLPDIVNYCNREGIDYTIITNNSLKSQLAIENLLLKSEYIQGLTSSVDPIIMSKEIQNTDRYKKSIHGLERLVKYKGIIKDLVAEITVDNDSIDYLYDLVKRLTDLGINSDITTIDISKSPFYDFSNVTDKKVLVPKSKKVYEIFHKIIEGKLDVHMADPLLDQIYSILPSDLDCEIEKDLHNITIDSDSSIRLCLRVRGLFVPEKFNVDNFMDDSGTLHPGLKLGLAKDKRSLCRNCCWTCILMSRMISKLESYSEKLSHKDKREMRY